MRHPLMTVWYLDSGNVVLELNENATPPGCAIELEVFDGGGYATSFGVWRLSQTGRVLFIVGAGES